MEMLWRARQASSLPLDYIRKSRPIAASVVGSHIVNWKQAQYPITGHHRGGNYEVTRVFDLEFPADFEFDWHHDYRNDKTVPKSFSRRLDIRSTDVVGDIKYIWEINRHQHLSAIAFSGRPDAVHIVSGALRNWLSNNPYLIGVNWTSSLELALRIISWAISYPVLYSVMERDPQLRDSFAQSVYLHLTTIRNHMSLYSSANNHLIGEMAGLYVGAVCFPWWNDCDQWRPFVKETLEREIQLQFASDGINREQATSYQLFTAELLLLAMLVGRNSADEFSGTFTARLRMALDYLANIATPTGDLPWFGDSDDARGFVFSQDDDALPVVMQLGALVFNEPRFAAFAPGVTAAAQALMPSECRKLNVGEVAPMPRTTTRFLRDGGIAVIPCGDWKLVMDVGPLGYTEIAAHGHADALSLQLAVGDQYLIVDSGTYAYHSHPVWRSYFRGTAAHNTARVDGLDQSIAAGRFLWSTKANTKVTEFLERENLVRISAEQDGYLRLPDPLLHRRTATIDQEEKYILVEDTFVCDKEHDVEIFWHLSERAILRQQPHQNVVAEAGDHAMKFSFSMQTSEVSIIRGAEDPILGWRSLAFNRKHPIPTIRIAFHISGKTTFATKIDLTQPSTGRQDHFSKQ